MHRAFFAAGAAAAGLAVAFGAFAAHALRARLSPEALAIFETGVRYQMYHGLAAALTALAWSQRPGRTLRLAGGCFLTGIALFSGSLYALALGGAPALGAVTPFGGLAFLAGWVALCVASMRGRARD